MAGKALTHFFLGTFTEGWVVLVLLGIIYDQLDISARPVSLPPSLPTGCILLGAPLTFPYGISESLLTPQLLYAARFGGLLVTIGLALALYVIVKNVKSRLEWYWKLILLLLTIKALAQGLVSVLPSAFWISNHGMRILYLHLLLLGGLAISLFSALYTLYKTQKGLMPIAISIILVLLSLVPLTPLWPASWFVSWIFQLIAALALLPVVAAAYGWYHINQAQQKTGGRSNRSTIS